MLHAVMPDELAVSITSAYKSLCGAAHLDVAVRSSATAEDLPQASFAAKHRSRS